MCNFDHGVDIEMILNNIRYFCSNKKHLMASRVLTNMANPVSPWKKYLKSEIGKIITETIIAAHLKVMSEHKMKIFN